MFAVIYVPNFALQALLRQEADSHDAPVALVEAGANVAKAVIVECTHAAEAAGVRPGFTAPQAQARCRELVLKSRMPAAERSATETLLQTAYGFSPNIEHTAPGVCTIDLRGLSFSGSAAGEVCENTSTEQQSFRFFQDAAQARGFFHPNRSALIHDWVAAIVGALRQLGLEAQVGIAITPQIALLAARATKDTFLVQHPDEFFQALPIAALEPEPHVLNVLKRWGIHTAGAFLALGKDAMAERLGPAVLEMFERASAETIRPLAIVQPADRFEEQMEFEVQIETIEPLLFVLRRFVEQLATRITLTYRVVAELQLTLALESGATYERSFKVPAPTTKVETLFRILHTHLEHLRTEAPIRWLRLAAWPVRAEGQQFGLFESPLRDPNHFHETLARLAALLGNDRVGTPVPEATHRPDAFELKTPEFAERPAKSKNGHTNRRNVSGLCLRRYRPAIHADVELKNGRPAFISSLVVNGSVIKKPRGPWCTSGLWWDERRWMRQEWDVEMSGGEIYRLQFKDGDWLIEGMYD